METNVGVLPLDQCRVVKEIHFDYKFGSKTMTAKVVYLRLLSENYNMTSEAEKKCCPCDVLDKLILDALTRKYDNVIVTDWLLVCDTHIERLNNIRKAALEVMTVIAGADLSLLSFFERLSIKKTAAIRFPIEVYVNNQETRSCFRGDVCDAYMLLEEWREKMPLIRQLLKKSYCALSDYLGSRGCPLLNKC